MPTSLTLQFSTLPECPAVLAGRPPRLFVSFLTTKSKDTYMLVKYGDRFYTEVEFSNYKRKLTFSGFNSTSNLLFYNLNILKVTDYVKYCNACFINRTLNNITEYQTRTTIKTCCIINNYNSFQTSL